MAIITNLVGYWSLGEASGTRSDSVGANHLSDNNTVTSTTGQVGNCAQFVAANTEYLSITDNTDLSMGNIDFSIAAWVQLADQFALNQLVAKSTGSDFAYHLFFNGGSTYRLKMEIANAVGLGGYDAIEATTFGLPPQDTWFFVVGWYDSVADTLNIQVNDGTVDSKGNSTGSFDDGGTFYLGRYDSFYFGGLLDEVGIWKKALTSAERTWLYNSGAGRSYADIVAESSGAAALPFVMQLGYQRI